jgi:hypothetical protein
MLYYGTSDDNVHPKNTLQLIQALQAAGKSFEVQVGPDKGHTGLDQAQDDGVLHRAFDPRPADPAGALSGGGFWPERRSGLRRRGTANRFQGRQKTEQIRVCQGGIAPAARVK